jgi:hypothetical protein
MARSYGASKDARLSTGYGDAATQSRRSGPLSLDRFPRTGSGGPDDVRDSSQPRHAIGALARSASSAEDCRDVARELFRLLAGRIAAQHAVAAVDKELGEIPLDRLGAQEARSFLFERLK